MSSREIFQARLRDELAYPALLVLEEAHNFVPAGASTAAVQRATTVTKQIAQEGRKFGLHLRGEYASHTKVAWRTA